MNFGPEVSTYKDKIVGVYGGKFLPLHQGHINCIIQAANQVDVLFVAIGYDVKHDESICQGTKFKYVSHRVRERWISEAVKDLPNIRVVSYYERRFDEWHNRPEIHESAKTLTERVGGKIDIQFSSEKEYESYFNEYYPNSKHVVLNSDKDQVDISATRIREMGVYKAWEYLPRSVQTHYVKRVCIIGGMSAGKTTVTKMLATMFNTNYVEEYGRTYYDQLGGYYDLSFYTDFNEIAIGHAHKINEAVKSSNKFLFIDTDNITTQHFMIHDRLIHSDLINEMIKANISKIDRFIFINNGNSYELDGTRPSLTDIDRDIISHSLKSMFITNGITYFEVDSSRDIQEIRELVIDLIE